MKKFLAENKDWVFFISVLMIMILLFYHPPHTHCMSKESVAKNTISHLETALSVYKEEHGRYPPDDQNNSSRPLIKFLDKEKTEGNEHFNFDESMIHNGRYFSNFAGRKGYDEKYEFHYRHPIEEEGKMNTDKPNLWTAGCDGEPKEINNFE